MASSVFPEPSAGGSSVAAFAANIAAKNVTNAHTNNFEAGVYTITCSPTSTDITVTFVDSTSVLTTQVTTSGTISFTLASLATKVFITAKNNATVFPTVVNIEQTANPLTSVDTGNGTLDTINVTGTYNQTGLLSVLAISGGGFGGMGGTGYVKGADGGAPGNIATGVAFTNTATTVTIGAGGIARNSAGGSDTAPTNSSFGNIVNSTTTSAFISRGGGGAGGNVNENSPTSNPGNINQTFPSWNTTGTSGGGGGTPHIIKVGGASGGGSGIGTGGAGAGRNDTNTQNATAVNNAGNGTGKGAGGGAGAVLGNLHTENAGRLGGDGSDGVIYVLRGF